MDPKPSQDNLSTASQPLNMMVPNGNCIQLPYRILQNMEATLLSNYPTWLIIMPHVSVTLVVSQSDSREGSLVASTGISSRYPIHSDKVQYMYSISHRVHAVKCITVHVRYKVCTIGYIYFLVDKHRLRDGTVRQSDTSTFTGTIFELLN